jgi:hypothetical protein
MEIPQRLQADAGELGRITGYPVELHRNGTQVFVIVRSVSLPNGIYTQATSDVLLITDVQYPTSAMDMFYMEESVHHAPGAIPPHASSVEEYAGRRWRRWSWHRNGKWTPGVDGLVSHWAFIEACWAKESGR